MKKMILSLLFASICLNGYSKTWTILSSGMTFSPNLITINQGDSVKFTIDGTHNAVEVSQTVWNANGTTANSGFSIPFGGGTVLPAKLAVGTHYYVCTPHAAFGMKGRIVVQTATNLSLLNVENNAVWNLNPNTEQLNFRFDFSQETVLEAKLYDLQGKLVTVLIPRTSVSGAYTNTMERNTSIKSGLYLLQVEVGSKRLIGKLMYR